MLKKPIVAWSLFIGFVGLVLVGACAAYYAVTEGVCENEIKAVVVSPDGQMKAVSIIRNCGATTSFSPQLSIVSTGWGPPITAGNTFITDHSDETIKVRWIDSHHLVVSPVGGTNIFRKETLVNAVSITYE